MSVPVTVVDSFADRPFTGNPAAVCPLDSFLDDAVLQAIALENNLSETAFCVLRSDGDFDLRWFTPSQEVDLCGHATLAAAHVLLPKDGRIVFHTRSGPLTVVRTAGLLEMDFPAVPPGDPVDNPGIAAALGVPVVELRPIREIHGAPYFLAELESEAAVRELPIPDLGGTNVIITARADAADLDFVSRFFAPGAGVLEDPVTGSAHCSLAPFWAERLGRNPLRARQVSARGGSLTCTVDGDRVRIAGSAVTVSEGSLYLTPPSDPEPAIRQEIERLHDFFVDWISGKLPNTDSAFAACADALAPGFAMVTPDGSQLERAELIAGLRGSHAMNPDFEIDVSEVAIRAHHGPLFSVSYVETQRGAKKSAANNTRLSLATLERTESGWRWHFVQETATKLA